MKTENTGGQRELGRLSGWADLDIEKNILPSYHQWASRAKEVSLRTEAEFYEGLKRAVRQDFSDTILESHKYYR